MRPDSIPTSVQWHPFLSAAGTLPLHKKVPESLRNQLGIAIAKKAYALYRDAAGFSAWSAHPKCWSPPAAAAICQHGNQGSQSLRALLYVQALALPSTINTMPEATLNALAAHPEFGAAEAENIDGIFTEFVSAGIDTDAVAAQLLEEGIASFAKSWNDLLDCIASKSEALKAA